MKVYFVIDIMRGIVVAAKKGERERYPPIDEVSEIVASSDPVEVIKSIGPRFLYAADLDRIDGRGDNTNILAKLAGVVDELMADCGFRSPEELEVPFTPVVGTETFDVTLLEKVARKCYVSLDFRDGLLDASGKFERVEDIVEFLNTLKIAGIIVLPLRSVGTLRADFELAEKVLSMSDHPVLLGGGISGVEDLERARSIGLAGVLIATAVHKRRIPIDIVRRGEF